MLNFCIFQIFYTIDINKIIIFLIHYLSIFCVVKRIMQTSVVVIPLDLGKGPQEQKATLRNLSGSNLWQKWVYFWCVSHFLYTHYALWCLFGVADCARKRTHRGGLRQNEELPAGQEGNLEALALCSRSPCLLPLLAGGALCIAMQNADGLNSVCLLRDHCAPAESRLLIPTSTK